jgi:hypothetical protein
MRLFQYQIKSKSLARSSGQKSPSTVGVPNTEAMMKMEFSAEH